MPNTRPKGGDDVSFSGYVNCFTLRFRLASAVTLPSIFGYLDGLLQDGQGYQVDLKW